MERGLIAFVEGRIERNFWSPRKDLDMRKLAAIEALSRYGKAQGRMLSSITIAPNQWPTHAVIDWVNVLRKACPMCPSAPAPGKRPAGPACRLSYQGTKLAFSTEQHDYWWWLMQNGDVNTARLMLAVMDDPAWKDDMGAWPTASSPPARRRLAHHHGQPVGRLALEKFRPSSRATPVSGTTKPRWAATPPAWTGARSSA
jgi:hypothetical protein